MIIYRLYFYFLIILFLHGCAAAVVTGGATGVAVAHDQRTTGTIIEDQAIEFKASQAFFKDKEINDNAHINVTSYNLVVLVTGEAPAEELRERIINIVRDIPKVTQVYNEITVAAPSAFVSRSSDSLITSKVKTKLLTLDNFDGTRVKVVTEKGVVYLMGLLTRAEADRATEATRQTGGVQKVVKLFQYPD
ncbi:MAG: BON domain-containing protein [Gammaproteobacteria bacterium]|nr:BON domain-containing protein [Gammaproteobacteria bacterium]